MPSLHEQPDVNEPEKKIIPSHLIHLKSFKNMSREHDLSQMREKVSVQVGFSERKMNLGAGWNDYTYILSVTDAFKHELSLRSAIQLPEGAFIRKNELHITVMGLGTKELIRAAVEKGVTQGQDVATAINKMLSELDFSFELDFDSAKIIHNLDYDPEAVRTKTGRAAFESEYTIIVDVDMPGMRTLYDRLRSELSIDLGKSASHVTLYIKDNREATGLGIGIYDLARQVRGELHPRIEMRPIASQELIE